MIIHNASFMQNKLDNNLAYCHIKLMIKCCKKGKGYFLVGICLIFSGLSGWSCTSKLVENWTLKWKHDAQFFYL